MLPTVSGFLRAALLSSLFTTLVLALVWWRSATLMDPATTNVGAAVALVLTAPSVISLFIIRPGEHALVSNTLLGPRLVLSVEATLPFVGAALFVLVGAPGRAHVWLGVLAALSVIIFAYYSAAALRSHQLTRRRDTGELDAYEIVPT